MAYIPAKCTQCGSNIKVDDKKDAGICEHCGTAFVTQKAINNYNNTFNIVQNITKHIYGNEQDESEDYLKNAEMLINLEDWEGAHELFIKSTRKNPGDYRSWVGVARCITKDWTTLENTNFKRYFDKAIKVAKSTDKIGLMSIYNTYISKFGCPRCKNEIYPDLICEYCGYDISKQKYEFGNQECPACFHLIDSSICEYCGYNLNTKKMPDGTIINNDFDEDEDI